MSSPSSSNSVPCRTSALLLLSLLTATFMVALSGCSAGSDSTSINGGSNTGGESSGGDGNGGNEGNGSGDGGAQAGERLEVEPSARQIIDVELGDTMPTVAFTASVGGSAVRAAWSVDRGDAATITAGPTAKAIFAPKGAAAGIVKVTAGFQGKTVEREVLIRLRSEQNGASTSQTAQVATSVAQITAGGGIGGVGGEGLGGAVSSASLRDALENPASDGSAEQLRFLYPYDGTVWPRGLPAPLLMWDWNVGDADAVRIELSNTSGSYRWSGSFAPPAILQQTSGAFVRHPIPQDVWDAATNSAGGLTADGKLDRLTLQLTVVKGSTAAGPISQSWTIAPARLSGIIYYNSYGTNLAKNFDGAVGGDHRFGGAVLSIHVGDTAPQLTAGASGAEANCRVCHSVAANGSRLVAVQGDRGKSSSYALTPTTATETQMTNAAEFPGLYPDGSLALLRDGRLLPMPSGAPAVIPAGLSAVTSDLGVPAFDPSGSRVAFNPMAGPIANPKQKLVVMAFDKGTSTFSNPVTVVDKTGSDVEVRPGWPAFLPDGQSLVFGLQSEAGLESNNFGDLRTRKGAKGQIVWTSASDADHVTPLDRLNGSSGGKSYLPKLAARSSLACSADGSAVGDMDDDHADDIHLNYEPTVNPVAGGGYAWVVFTSRRLYGNFATIPPFCSDPRGVDLITHVTTKKLWVAAIDLGAKPGKDASHPAFYLPSQELLAGNARGFWTLDPCRSDGASCESGDQCCGGYCTASGEGGALVCGNAPPDAGCASEGDKCESPTDCCDADALCVNGFCSAVITPE